MSAALTLPYVWATVNEQAVERNRRLRPLGGLAFYRKRTEILLRRYIESVSMDMGRVPSVMGNLKFRGRGSSYRIRNFEDAVIFVIDVERCLKRLDGFYTGTDCADSATGVHAGRNRCADEAGCADSDSEVCTEILDRLTSIFLERELLIPDLLECCQEDD